MSELPDTWTAATLADVSYLNPGWDNALEDDTIISFVPMSAAEAGTGRLDVSATRSVREVKNGFTRFQDGDVLFAKITPSMENGKVVVAWNLRGGFGAGTTEFHVVRTHGGILSEYILYFLLQEGFRREARMHMKGVAGQLRVPIEFLADALLPLPPLPEQHRIVAAIEEQFTRLDVAVAALKRVQANLKRYRASVLKAACQGRLVPTEAELARAEGREYEPASQPVAFGDAVLLDYKIPDGWMLKTIGEITEIIIDCPHSTPEWTEMGKVCLRTTQFRPGRLDLSEVRYVSGETYARRISRGKPKARDVLYSREGGILGIACQVPVGVDLCLGQRMMLLRAGKQALPEYIMHLLNSPFILARVKSLTGGSASPHLNVGDVKRFTVPLPSVVEQQRIVDEIERLLSVAEEVEETVEQQLAHAERLRQAILKRAFEGKLVPQDPNDEPAEKLLEQIRVERQAQTKFARMKSKRR